MNKVKLNFYIHSYNSNAKNGEPFELVYDYYESFDKEIVLQDALNKVFNKFVISNELHDIYITEELPKELWKKYFNEDIIPYISINSIYNATLEYLEEQFEISKVVIKMMINPPIGATVCDCEGIKIFFHMNEKDLHNRPHIHCSYSGQEFRVDLNTLKIIDKPFKEKKKNKLTLNIIKKNQQQFLNYWEQVIIKGENIKLELELY